jgi:A/G-specific adenine glycosylase
MIQTPRHDASGGKRPASRAAFSSSIVPFPLEKKDIAAFRRTVYAHFRRHRRDLPWRRTEDPFHILVSEVMLQQTQVPRVLEKYAAFIEAFHDAGTLARTPLHRVMKLWQGLGYNRRAAALKRAALLIVNDCGGVVPRSEETLVSVPGIGRATACAIRAFAFNEPVVFIETNIRAVFIHHFFRGGETVSDDRILPLVTATLDRRNPRRWYSALMDYGSALKKTGVNPSRRSSHYRRQSPFEGSNRQVRGAVVKALVKKRGIEERELVKETGFATALVRRNLDAMEREGLVVRRGGRVKLG